MEQFGNENRYRYLGAVESNTFRRTASSKINAQRNEIGQTYNSSDSVINTNVKYNSVDDIIQKYKCNTPIQGNKNYLHRNVGNHALFEANVEFTHSFQSCMPKYNVNETLKCKSEIKHILNKVNDEIMNHDHRNYACYRYENDHLLQVPNDVKVTLTSNEKLYHDKTTYCRPVINYYNEQFLYKTMERNARLKRLVRKLAFARQKEKETVGWNNFINELKNKHEMNCEESRLPTNEPGEYITPDIINDYYNTKFSCIQSRPCKYLLREFYGYNDESQSDCTYYRQVNQNRIRQNKATKHFPHEINHYCYPTSSQGRLIMMDRERRFKHSLNHWPNHLSDKNLNTKNGGAKRYLGEIGNIKINKKNSKRNEIISHNRATSFDNTTPVQDDIKLYPNLTNNKHQDKATYKQDEVKEEHDTYKNVKNQQESDNYLKRISLINIDTKLETLIESINTFIAEIKSNKSKRRKMNDNYLKCKHDNKSENTKNVSDSKVRTMETVDTSDISENKFNVSNLYRNQWPIKSNELQGHNMHYSKSLEISNAFTKQPCSVQITFEVPTKDCSTEVTKSLSKQNTYSKNKEAIIEEISTPEHIVPLKRMTIAVNTDPLSFLGLLKVSTDTFKRFLSFMPNFDYYSYLSLLQLPFTPNRIEPHYVCNICGADFNRPSQLSDHIRHHDQGNTKDCCVCRHVLDTARKSSGLFRCRYCGQLFARAYCCELHQESCARRLGRHHDVTSSLMLLR